MTDLINASILGFVEKNMNISKHSVNISTNILFWNNIWLHLHVQKALIVKTALKQWSA